MGECAFVQKFSVTFHFPDSPAALFPVYRPVNAVALTAAGASRVRAAHEPAHGRDYQPIRITYMTTFIEDFERSLARKLEACESDESLIRWASEKVLESYRNGITAGQKGTVIKHAGESRRHGIVWTPEMRGHLGELVKRGLAEKARSKEKRK